MQNTVSGAQTASLCVYGHTNEEIRLYLETSWQERGKRGTVASS